MQRLINTVAQAAALTAILFCIWSDYSLLITLRRALVSYVVFAVVASLLVLIFRMGVLAETKHRPRKTGGGGSGTKPGGTP
jgi:hypothetical protein